MEDDAVELEQRIFDLEQKLANVKKKTEDMQVSPSKSGSRGSSLGSSFDGKSRSSHFQRLGVGRYDRDVGDLAQSKESAGFEGQHFEAKRSQREAVGTSAEPYEAPTAYAFSQELILRQQIEVLQSQLAKQQRLNEQLEQRYRSEIDRIKGDAAKYLVEKDEQIADLEEALQVSSSLESPIVARLSYENEEMAGRLSMTKVELNMTKELLEDFKEELMKIKQQFGQLKENDKHKSNERSVKALEVQARELETDLNEERNLRAEVEKRYKTQVQSLEKDLRVAHESIRKAEGETKQLQRQHVHVTKEHQREIEEVLETIEESKSVKAAQQQVSEQQTYTLELNEHKRELHLAQRKLLELANENQFLKANQSQPELPRPSKRQRPKTYEISGNPSWDISAATAEANPITSCKSEEVLSLEKELMSLQQDKQRLEAEFVRMPEYPKTIEGKKNKQKTEYELRVLDTNIVEIKRQLRAMKAIS